MGGHGTWNLGVHFPGRFAAIGPSAGWVSFWSYGGGAEYPDDEMGRLLRRAASPSDTLGLLDNLADRAVYIVHGTGDRNVPVAQADTMIEALQPWHPDLHVHLEPDAGHSWNRDKEQPGQDYIDFPAMYDLFSRRRLPAGGEVRQLRFTTVNPQISAQHHWVTVAAQRESLAPSVVKLRCFEQARRFTGTTSNVRRMALDVAHLEPGEIALELDGQALAEIPRPEGARLWLERDEAGWSVTPPPPPGWKGPHRAGPFKEAFQNRMLFVYGTAGSDEQDAWCLARARYDAEVFWYRGAGSVEIVADVDLQADRHGDRNVILYGNAATNAAWEALLGHSPLQVLPGRVQVGERRLEGDDLACVFTYPRAGSDTALVAAVAGTGPVGSRLTERLPYFVSGAAFPDWMVIGPEMLLEGAAGVRAAGFFGHDWSLAEGQASWRQP